MENILDYFWQENEELTGLFVQLYNKKYYYVHLHLENKDKEKIKLIINNEIWDETYNCDDFWYILELIMNHTNNEHIKNKIKNYFIKNGWHII